MNCARWDDPCKQEKKYSSFIFMEVWALVNSNDILLKLSLKFWKGVVKKWCIIMKDVRHPWVGLGTLESYYLSYRSFLNLPFFSFSRKFLSAFLLLIHTSRFFKLITSMGVLRLFSFSSNQVLVCLSVRSRLIPFSMKTP